MAKPLTDTERQHILNLLNTGKSCRDIANETNRSPDTISRIARAAGHTFGQTNLARAHEARRSYGAERRAETSRRLHEEAERLLDSLHAEHVAFSFGGRDNTYTEHVFDEPDVGSKHTIIRAVRDCLRTVLDIDRHDNRGDEVGSDFDEWLSEKLGGGVT